jgi:ATP-dependent helicase HrpB
MMKLPIDSYLPQIVSVLKSNNSLVLTAPPGAGKSTRVPRALYDAGFAEKGEILILEPRRLAARVAAMRVAEELGELPGETVGYSIRFENVAGPRTRIRFLTEAILARRIVHDPNLEGVSAVILDEFHERHLSTDLALALLKRLQARNPGLKIAVMSATLNPRPLSAFLQGAQLLSLSESPFDVEIQYENRPSDRSLHEKVASAVYRLLNAGTKGDVLVFLPGAAEMRRSGEALAPHAERFNFLITPLHGDLPWSEQNRAIIPAERRKVILATNVAETSITIPGIAAVIDSGLARVAGHSAWSGLPTLSTSKISRSSAIQRAGRAGRTQAGLVLRLYTRSDFESRPEHDVPEIKRVDLAEAILTLHGAGIRDAGSFAWFESPPGSSVEAAENLLARLGALDAGRITPLGIQMLRLPLHPRLARLIAEGEKLGALNESALLAALLSERDIRLEARSNLGSPGVRAGTRASSPSDLLELLDRFREAEDARFASRRLRAIGLDSRAVEAVRRSQQQLERILEGQPPVPLSPHKDTGERPPPSSPETEQALLMAILAGFPDRVAKRRKAGSRELLLSAGGSAVLSPASVVHEPILMVAVDAQERKERLSTDAVVRIASAIESEWLAALFPEALSESTELLWNEQAGRVDEVRRTYYGQISLEESIRPAALSKETARLLASAALSKHSFPDFAAVPEFQARLSLAAKAFPEEEFPQLEEQDIEDTIIQLCTGKRALDELTSVSLVEALMSRLTPKQRSTLSRELPERIRLNEKHTAKIHYEAGKPPWIESRLQDFFGLRSTPMICRGLPLTLHLLAPNGRAVQVTQDLAGFWERHYPAIKRELKRRYPRHAWPEYNP